MSVSAMKQALEALEFAGDLIAPITENCQCQICLAHIALKQAIEFEEMVEKGTKAWDGTPDDWVDDLRGGAEKQDPDDDIYDIWVEQEIKEKNVPQP